VESVNYTNRFDYAHDQEGRPFPLLPLRISLERPPLRASDVDGYLDTVAYRSLFNGQIATLLGLDLSSGPLHTYVSTMGIRIEARIHEVWVSNTDLGSFRMKVGFSTRPITRNLLSRDFLNLIQLGFRERHLRFFVTPTP